MGFIAQVSTWAKDLKLIPGIQVLVCPPDAVQPVFIRFPKEAGRCPITGLSLGSVRTLVKESRGKIVVRVVKRPGAKRMVKLIEVDSYVKYLNEPPVADAADLDGDEEGGEAS